MEEILEDMTPEMEAELEQVPQVETSEETPVDEVENEAEISAQIQLQAVTDALVAYGGSGNVETVAQELVAIMEDLLSAQALEVERSEKVGRLTFALSQIVHDAGAVLALIDVETLDFDPSNLAELRDFLEPIYQQKPYLFKVISPLRGASIVPGFFGNTLPSNAELGALSMEEYTAYRNAQGSVSR